MVNRRCVTVLFIVMIVMLAHAQGARATPSMRSPQQGTVEQFYVDLHAQAYSDAYSYFSDGFAARTPYQNWVSGYDTTSDFDWSTWETSDPNAIGVHLHVIDAVAGPQEFEGVWHLVSSEASPSGWLLDSARIVASAPLATPMSGVAEFIRFSGGWSRHGFSIFVDPGGRAIEDFRTYSWCGDDPTPPCDIVVGNGIHGGGHAAMTFTYVDGDTAYGTYDDGGDVSLTLLTYGMATLTDLSSGEGTLLCGPDFASLAPESLLQSSPCGA